MKKDKQIIKCDVYDCKHCDFKNNFCNLKEIKISNCNKAKEKEATMCASYDIRN